MKLRFSKGLASVFRRRSEKKGKEGESSVSSIEEITETESALIKPAISPEKLKLTIVRGDTKLLETYPLYEPWAYAYIAEDRATSVINYIVYEVGLTPQEEEVYKNIIDYIMWELEPPKVPIEDVREYISRFAKRAIRLFQIRLGRTPGLSWSKIGYYIERDVIGYGPIDPLMRDPNIEDISCVGPGIPVYVWHRKYEYVPTSVVFKTSQELDEFVVKLAHLAGKHISVAYPVLDAILPGGHRIAATFQKEISTKGSTFTIRKFREDPITIVDLINFGTISPEIAAYFWLAMDYKMTTLILGVTGAGKTSTLNALANLLRPTYKIVTIEDTPELRLPQENWVQLTARPTYLVSGVSEIKLFDLVKVSLRYRPDVIVVGEIRGEEAYVLFQAIATGHSGMCLPEDQLVPAIVDGRLDLYEIGDIVKGALLNRYRDIKVSAYVDGRPRWVNISRVVVKNGSNRFIRIHVAGGVVHEVHEDHPMVVYVNGELKTKRAKELREGDLLVSIAEIPPLLSGDTATAVNVLDLLKESWQHLYVKLPPLKKYASVTPARLASLLGVRRTIAKKWVYEESSVPARYVEMLVKQKLIREEDLRDASVKYGRYEKDGIKVSIPLNFDLGYILGSFLAGGHIEVDHHNVPNGVIFYVGKNPKLAEEISERLSTIVSPRSIKVRMNRGRYIVNVRSKTFALLISSLLNGNASEHDRYVPLSLALLAPEEFRKGIISGFWHVNRWIRSYGNEYSGIRASTVSRKLAESMASLLRSLGVVATVALRGSGKDRDKKEAVVYTISVVGCRDGQKLTEIFGGQIPATTGSKVRSIGGLLLHRVKKIEMTEKDSLLYDIEVPGSHTYAISGGFIVTHNTTLHSEDINAAVKRLTSPPMNIPESYMPLVNMALVIKRVTKLDELGRPRPVRRITNVWEIEDFNKYRELASWDPARDRFKANLRESLIVERIAEMRGLSVDEVVDDVIRRRAILEYLAATGKRSYREIATYVYNYYYKPKEVLKEIGFKET